MARSARLVVSVSSLLVISLLAMALLSMAIGCGGGGAQSSSTTSAGSTVAVSFAAPTPVAVAEKIGTGNWTAASLPSGGPLMVQLPPGTTQYGVAFVCTSVRSGTQVKQQFIIQADIKDGNAYTLQQCLPDFAPPLPTGSLTGSFDASAIAGTSQVEISVDNFSSNLVAATPTGSFNITTAQVGLTDAFAVAYDSSHTLLAMKIVRSQTVPGVANGGNPITLAASDAVTTSMPISLANVPAGFPQVFGIHFPSYVTANGGYAMATGFNGFIPTGYSVVPATQAQPSDYYLVDMLAAAGNQQVTTSQRLKTAAPVTLTLPNPWTAIPPTPARFPTFTFDYTGFTGQPAIADVAGLGWTQSGVSFGMSVIATANSQNGATTLTFPDLTALPGFLSMAPSGTIVGWSAATWGGTAQFFATPAPIPQTISNASDQGNFTQP
jgi:hypothetical protein